MSEQLASAIMTEKPSVRWDDVAGLVDAKTALQEAAVLPIRFPQLFAGGRLGGGFRRVTCRELTW